MKNRVLFIISILFFIQTSCASFNRANGEIEYSNHISKGQELLDLKKALVEGAINQKEYDLMKKKIIDDQYIKDIINEFDDEEEDNDKGKKAKINLSM